MMSAFDWSESKCQSKIKRTHCKEIFKKVFALMRSVAITSYQSVYVTAHIIYNRPVYCNYKLVKC
jgi:hypothetical protein